MSTTSLGIGHSIMDFIFSRSTVIPSSDIACSKYCISGRSIKKSLSLLGCSSGISSTNMSLNPHRTTKYYKLCLISSPSRLVICTTYTLQPLLIHFLNYIVDIFLKETGFLIPCTVLTLLFSSLYTKFFL